MRRNNKVIKDVVVIMNYFGMYFYVRYFVFYKKRSVIIEDKRVIILRSGEYYVMLKREMRIEKYLLE